MRVALNECSSRRCRPFFVHAFREIVALPPQPFNLRARTREVGSPAVFVMVMLVAPHFGPFLF